MNDEMPFETITSPALEITASRQFTAWLAEQHISLAFTTYQTGKLFLIGLQPSGELSVFERTFNRAMGLYASSNQLYLSSLYQLWQFENALEPGQLHEGYDRLYVPQVGYTTGDLDIHDIALSEQRQILFVNTLFSCLATISQTHSFTPLWHPPFISKLAAEDRCHLNGLAMRDGKPRYMTAIAQTDVADGWRDRRHNGGCVIDIENNEIIAAGLSMPHSPRWHLNQLWLLNSGTGEFGKLDLNRGEFQPITFCPGYLRGLAFSSNFVIVGLSKPRHNKTFSGLALDETLTAKNADARAGLQVIDLNSGDAVHWLRIEGVIEEMYDVVVLPNVQRPMALGFKSDEIRRVITIGA
ncbi:TIGR03032 family protein [Scytonema sp. PRP1]|uniref:TIGR03032 family protein n=1 Tax=Scytonema sp. PRP1 TaxID=3120513 RepID=UPI00300CDB9C